MLSASVRYKNVYIYTFIYISHTNTPGKSHGSAHMQSKKSASSMLSVFVGHCRRRLIVRKCCTCVCEREREREKESSVWGSVCGSVRVSGDVGVCWTLPPPTDRRRVLVRVCVCVCERVRE